MSAVRPPDTPRLSARGLLSSCRSALVSTAAFSFVINMLMLTGPLFMLQVYDRVLTSGSVPTLVALLVLVAFLFAFVGVLELVRSRVMVRVARRLDEQLGVTALKAVIAHALRRTEGVHTQPVRDVDAVRQFVAGPGPLTLFDAPWTPVYLAVIFLLHWWLGILALGGAVILFCAAYLNERLTRDRLARASRATLGAHALAAEGQRNCEALRAMGMEAAFRDKWRDTRDAALDSHISASDRGADFTSLSKAARLFMQSAMLGLGAYLAVRQQITPGTIIAASVILGRALQPVEQAIAHWRGFAEAHRAFARLNEACAAVADDAHMVELPAPLGRLDAENLFVVPPGAGEPVLRNVSLAVRPGEAVGVIGVTGSGKSTLIRTLAGIWPAAKGTVRYDGAAFEQWTAERLGPHLGYLPQEVQLFSGTVAENIARMDPEPDSEQVVAAARRACVHDMILRLPDGYETQLGDNGAALSAGQRQRLGLARALYGDPKYVLLDEPNSNLDTEGEGALIKAIADLKANGCSVIVAAHRPSAISVADRLMILKDGQVAALGPRDEILKAVSRPGPAPRGQVRDCA